MGNFSGKEADTDDAFSSFAGDDALYLSPGNSVNINGIMTEAETEAALRDTNNDASMLAAEVSATAPNRGGNANHSESNNSLANDIFEDNTVPMVFRWEGGGNQVYIAGTFNKWAEKIPMQRSGHDFTYIHNLVKGKHAYKFIVDDEWRFAQDQPTVADTSGNINNICDLTTFESTLRNDKSEMDCQDYIVDDSKYGEYVPGMGDYTTGPPPLPPHLRQIILNSSPTRDRYGHDEMETPQHVTLDHLYCTALKRDGLMVLGITQRVREKFVTTVYYSPEEPFIGVGTTNAQAASPRHHKATAHDRQPQGSSPRRQQQHAM